MMFNWVDWIIIVLCLYEMYQGWKLGFVSLGISFISFALSLWFAILYNAPVSHFFQEKFGISAPVSTAFSYLTIAFSGQMIFVRLLALFVNHLPKKIEQSKINSALGSVVSTINALTTVAFVLLIILALPLRGTVQTDIRSSKIGSMIVAFVSTYAGPIKTTVDQVEKDAMKFLTISPGSKESMPLDVSVAQGDLTVDDEKERQFLLLVNEERLKAGAKPLVVDVKIVSVARKHSTDMLLRKYFSYFTPEKLDLGNRLDTGEVKYSMAGENIAYAPNVTLAHQGLMNSPEHKKNLLDPQFLHVGIGVISTNKFGIMVTQDFIN
jgi:uncharacterized protein YkwD